MGIHTRYQVDHCEGDKEDTDEQFVGKRIKETSKG